MLACVAGTMVCVDCTMAAMGDDWDMKDGAEVNEDLRPFF